MTEKDFLSQFSNENKKPDSFKEEERIPVHKEKKPVNIKALIIVLVTAIVLLVGAYFVFLAPKIEMPDFTGKTVKDVTAWVKQQGIETNGIVFNEEYNFETDEETILEQDVPAGKKVKENVKITFTVSLGADPDELIKIPDLYSMEKADIQEWISKNKLTKTKVTTAYSDVVEENQVISVDFSGCEEDTFTRSSTLKIQVSKGSAPAGTVTIEDFKDKTYSYVETWAKAKKIELEKIEQFSKTVALDVIIGQSVEAGRTLKEGEKLTVTVSLGEGVVVPDFRTISKSETDEWLNKYGVKVSPKYSNSSDYIVEQSIASGKTASLDNLKEMKVTKNLGSSFYLVDEGFTKIVGMNYNELVDLCNAVRAKGIDAYAGNWNSSNEEYSYTYSRGTVVSVKYTSYSTGKEYYENDRMPLDIRFEVIVSKGKISVFDKVKYYDESANNFKKTELIDALASESVNFSNHCGNDVCRLLVNGSAVTVKNTAGEYSFEIVETDTVELAD